MAKTVFTGWRKVTPGKCFECGCDDGWVCDGRGNVLCDCQACSGCGILDAYGFHEPGCPTTSESAEYVAENAGWEVPVKEEDGERLPDAR